MLLAEDVLEAACDGANDTWYDGQLCTEVTCPEPPATGACCEGALCTDNVFEVACAGHLVRWSGLCGR